MGAGEKPIDWGMGEALAFGTLLAQGMRVRLSRAGLAARHLQPPPRGALRLQRRPRVHAARPHRATGRGPFEINDSPLSEAGVLGFDYGYSLDMPEGLVIWEAQFGDFVNAAQVIIDQFLVLVGGQVEPGERPRACCCRTAWRGRGPSTRARGSSASCNLCVNDNIQVCNLTTPAQYFHAAAAAGAASLPQAADHHVAQEPAALAGGDVVAGGLHRRARSSHIIPDATVHDPEARSSGSCSAPARSITTWSRRAKSAATTTWPSSASSSFIRCARTSCSRRCRAIAEGTPVVWVQEEPQNMGAWRVHEPRAAGAARGDVPVVVRQPAAVGQPGDRLARSATQARAGAS